MQLTNTIRQTAHSLNGDEPVRRGIVSGYDPNAYAIKVKLQPDGNETGWIPLEAAWVGNGWGMFAPPSLGDDVEISFQEGSASAGMAGGRTFNDVDRPLAVQSGEFWLVHKEGASLKLTNDGKVAVNSAVEIDATGPVINLTATGNVNVVAPSITLAAAGQALKSFITEAFIALFNTHTHTSTNAGTQTSTPTQQMNAATHATSTVKGG